MASPLTLAWANAPVADEWQIDSIVLTFAPCYGPLNDMTDDVTILRPHIGTVRTQTILKGDKTVLEQQLFIAKSEDLAALVSSLYTFGFFDMPEYLGTNIMDGRYTWITVNTIDGRSIRVGDLFAEECGPEEFIAIFHAIEQVKLNAIEYEAFSGVSSVIQAATIPLGQETSIIAHENMTTPYRLLLVLTDETVMELAGDEYIQDPNPNDADGVGGNHHFHLKAVGLGECSADLYLVYINDTIDRAENKESYLFTVVE